MSKIAEFLTVLSKLSGLLEQQGTGDIKSWLLEMDTAGSGANRLAVALRLCTKSEVPYRVATSRTTDKRVERRFVGPRPPDGGLAPTATLLIKVGRAPRPESFVIHLNFPRELVSSWARRALEVKLEGWPQSLASGARTSENAVEDMLLRVQFNYDLARRAVGTLKPNGIERSTFLLALQVKPGGTCFDDAILQIEALRGSRNHLDCIRRVEIAYGKTVDGFIKAVSGKDDWEGACRNLNDALEKTRWFREAEPKRTTLADSKEKAKTLRRPKWTIEAEGEDLVQLKADGKKIDGLAPNTLRGLSVLAGHLHGVVDDNEMNHEEIRDPRGWRRELGRELRERGCDASSLVARARRRGYKLCSDVALRGFGEVPTFSPGDMGGRGDRDDDSR